MTAPAKKHIVPRKHMYSADLTGDKGIAALDIAYNRPISTM